MRKTQSVRLQHPCPSSATAPPASRTCRADSDTPTQTLRLRPADSDTPTQTRSLRHSDSDKLTQTPGLRQADSDKLTQTLRLRHADSDTPTQTLRLRHADSYTPTQTRRLRHADSDTMTQTLRLRHSDSDTPTHDQKPHTGLETRAETRTVSEKHSPRLGRTDSDRCPTPVSSMSRLRKALKKRAHESETAYSRGRRPSFLCLLPLA